MDQQEIRALLEQVAQGQRSVDEAVLALKMEPLTRSWASPRWTTTGACARARRR